MDDMKIALTGATGLIGTALCENLLRDGHQVVALGRDPEKIRARLSGVEAVQWEATAGPPPAEALETVDAVVNLAGESIASSRWTTSRKQAIRDSRVQGTRHLRKALAASDAKPAVLVNGSAIGFYGDRGEQQLDERSDPGSGFLSDVCRQWEAEALEAESEGIRVVLLRTGIVLSAEGGALQKMLPPFKMFAGGPLGSGKQWMSWIHLADEVGLIREAISNPELSGSLNATSPDPRTNAEFSRALGKALGRPAVLPAPGFALKLLLGEMAQALLLEGQRVYPQKALDAGFRFQFPKLEEALADLLGA